MEFINVMSGMGVYADGIHDDTKALQMCLDKLKNGGTIYFPDGVYLISSSLIFYSNQHLNFSDNAVLLRSDKSEPITKYMLASYSDPVVAGYNGTHDVVISGGIFNGNSALTEKLTILNTVHCKNINVKNCKFINCSMWHCIEFNSTKKSIISGCIFDGYSYTAIRENLTSELVQVDAAQVGLYGPVYDYSGNLIDFLPDGTPCCDINIESCLFKCNGFTAIGHHGDHPHKNIEIINNTFEGTSGIGQKSRGYIVMQPRVSSVTVYGNKFISGAKVGDQNIGIDIKNSDKAACVASGNQFKGYFSEYFIGGITQKDNIFE